MGEHFAKEQDSIRANVITLCREHPEAKHDYRTLLQYYWYYIDGLKDFVPMNILKRLDQPESICRAFRKAVEEGSIDLNNNEKVKRVAQEKNYREYYSAKTGRFVREPI